MTDAQGNIDAAALAWAIRVKEPDFAEWKAFADWLGADPRHAERYHLIEHDASALAELIPPPAPGEHVPAARPHRRRWLAGALAASVAAVAGYSTLQMRHDFYAVETMPGARRVIIFADGSSIALNGATKLTLDRRDERFAALEQGEALFSVRHDPARPFKVKVGGSELVDVGTVFDVVRSDGKMWVGVAEGALIFNPRNEAVPVPAGRSLRINDASDTVQVGDVAVASVGDWRQDRLDFAGVPLREVAAALSRSLGSRFTVAPAIADRQFRGTIALTALRRDPKRLELLLDVRVRRAGGGWEIAPRP